MDAFIGSYWFDLAWVGVIVALLISSVLVGAYNWRRWGV